MSGIAGWHYYNHALLPDCPPDAAVDTSLIRSGEIWQTAPKRALFARWTTDFDCGYDTGWYYIIREAPFDLEALDRKRRKHIRQALRKTYVKKVDPREYAEQLYAVDLAACQTYSNYTMQRTVEELRSCADDRTDYWAAFSAEDDRLVGFLKCQRMDTYVETQVGKYSPQDLKLQASDALHYAILEYYLNEKGYRYCSSGSRNISHKTNVQEYLSHNFGYKKAYCRLHICYRPVVGAAVKVLYPFRGLLKKLDGIGIIHKINGILIMEEIVRKQGNALV